MKWIIKLGNIQIPAATSVQKVLIVSKQDQYINFSDISSVNYGAESVSVPLTSTASLPLTYTSSNNSVATVEDYFIHFNGAGSATISAFQTGDGNFLPAQSVSRQVRVYRLNQSIAFSNLPVKVYGDAPFNLLAFSTSGLPVTFVSSDDKIATIKGSELTIKGAGTITIKAIQSGNSGYQSSEQSRELTINKKNQIITFEALSAKKFGDVPFIISATSDSKFLTPSRIEDRR